MRHAEKINRMIINLFTLREIGMYAFGFLSGGLLLSDHPESPAVIFVGSVILGLTAFTWRLEESKQPSD